MSDSLQDTELNTTLIADTSELRALGTEWNDLLTRSASPQMSLSWEWIESWLDAIENRIIPFVVVTRYANGQLCGVAPFYFWKYKFLNIWVDILRPLADHHTGQMYPSWIIDQDHSREITHAIARELEKRRRDYDLIWIQRMGTWNQAVSYLQQGLDATSLTIRQRPCSYSAIQLPATADEYKHQLGRKISQNLRRTARKIGKSGGEIITCDSETQLEQFMQALFSLHKKRWAHKGELGLFEKRPLAKRFYEEFLPKAASSGWLRLKAIQAANSFKAIKLGYAFDKSLLSVQAGFDPDYISGAANVLQFDVICSAIEEGLETYDFLFRHNKHKSRWNARERLGSDLFVASNSLTSILVSRAGVWPDGRFLKPVKIPT